MVSRTFSLAALLAFTSPSFAHDYHVGDLLIEHPWSRELPVDLPGGAVYFSVSNQGDQDDRLVGVTSSRAQKSEVHVQAAADGLMDMQHAPVIDIPAHASVVFQPGGNHVMLSGTGKTLKAGEHFPLTLSFEKAGSVVVQVTVGPAEAETGHEAHRDH